MLSIKEDKNARMQGRGGRVKHLLAELRKIIQEKKVTEINFVLMEGAKGTIETVENPKRNIKYTNKLIKSDGIKEKNFNQKDDNNYKRKLI